MPEKVELVFKRVKTREKSKDLIIRYFSERFIGTGEDYEFHPEGISVPETEKIADKIYAVYQKIFYLSDKRLIIVRPTGGLHILEFSEVSREFFATCNYPEPTNLLELLDTLRWKSLKGYKFTGPSQIRQFVKHLSHEEMENFQLQHDPLIWQAAVCCKCECDVFGLRTLGEVNSEGLLCDTDGELQRVELLCKDCGRKFFLFDAILHGYNAVIDKINFASVSRQVKNNYQCKCSYDKFQIAVSVIYDASPETLAEFTQKERNNSYGWFYAFLKCAACNRLINFVNYECA
jgi:hypothetical protein